MEDIKNRISINIIGCCVTRDIFGICDNLNEYDVKYFRQYSNPISFMQKTIENLFLKSLKSLESKSFFHRSAIADVNKEILSAIVEHDCEYLLLDLADLRIDLLKISIDNKLVYMTDSPWLKEKTNIDKMIENHFNAKFETVPYNSFSIEEIKKLMDPFIDVINDKFKNKKVIIVETLLEKYLVSENLDKLIPVKYPDIDGRNVYIKELTRYIKDKISNAYFIPMPKNVLCDLNHKWGINPLHYLKDYYDYAFECIQSVAQYGDKKFGIIKEKYEKIFTDIYNLVQARQALEQKKIETKKWTNYSNIFKSIIINNITSKKIEDKLLSFGYKKIALYGFMETTIVLLKLLKDTSITIEFMVEDNYYPNCKNYSGKLIPRGSKAEDYAKVDCIIICDINWLEAIKIKLEGLVTYPILSIYDLIK